MRLKNKKAIQFLIAKTLEGSLNWDTVIQIQKNEVFISKATTVIKEKNEKSFINLTYEKLQIDDSVEKVSRELLQDLWNIVILTTIKLIKNYDKYNSLTTSSSL